LRVCALQKQTGGFTEHFKNTNDRLGHPGGDEILKQFGTRLQERLRRGIQQARRT